MGKGEIREIVWERSFYRKRKSFNEKKISEGKIPVVAGGQSYAYYTNIATHKIPTITISASGAYAGFVWFHNYPIWASDCNVLYVTKGSTKFLYFALKSIQHRIYALQSGGAQPHIYSKDLKNIKIQFPALELQQQISHILTTVQDEINYMKVLVEKYRTQKRGLMQKLLTGKWQVKFK